jgi:hypothetical protein
MITVQKVKTDGWGSINFRRTLRGQTSEQWEPLKLLVVEITLTEDNSWDRAKFPKIKDRDAPESTSTSAGIEFMRRVPTMMTVAYWASSALTWFTRAHPAPGLLLLWKGRGGGGAQTIT